MFRAFIAFAVAGLSAFAIAARADPPPIEAYGKLPSVELMRLSPSGDRYAFIAVDGEQRKLFAAAIADNRAISVALVGTLKVSDLAWAGEDHLMVELHNTSTLGPDFTRWKAELTDVEVLNLSNGKLSAIFQHATGIANFVYGTYGYANIRNHWYGYFGGLTYEEGVKAQGDFFIGHGYPDLYRVDLDTGAATIVSHGNEISQDWLVAPSGEVVARSTYDDQTGDWQVLSEKDLRILASGRAKFGFDELHNGHTPDRILIARPDENDGSVVYQELPISGGATVDIPDSDVISDRLFDPVSGLWIGITKQGDQPETQLFNAGFEAKMLGTRKAFPGQTVQFVSADADFSRIIVMTTGSGDSGTYWIVDIAHGTAIPAGYAYPTVTPADVGPIRMVDYKAADGLALHGVLSLPPGRDAKNLPLVVLPHGGPESRDYPVFHWWAQAFVSRGYAVFQPNFRGSSGYGVDFRNAGFGQWGRKMQTDISDGVSELARQGIVDPKRACIVGGSYGGYAALAGVTVQHGLYRCAVSVAGVSDLAGMTIYAEQETEGTNPALRYWKTFMGVTTAFETELNDISPVRLAGRADAPILLIHGKDDTVVPIDQSREMQSALLRAGKSVEYVELPGEDHWLSREATRIAMLKASVAFVEKYNPSDAPQAVTASAVAPGP